MSYLTIEDRLSNIEENQRLILQTNASILKKIEQQYKNPSDEILSVDEAAIFLKISIDGVYRLSANNEITYFKSGRKNCYKKSDLEAYLFSNKIKSNAELNREAEQYIARSNCKK